MAALEPNRTHCAGRFRQIEPQTNRRYLQDTTWSYFAVIHRFEKLFFPPPQEKECSQLPHDERYWLPPRRSTRRVDSSQNKFPSFQLSRMDFPWTPLYSSVWESHYRDDGSDASAGRLAERGRVCAVVRCGEQCRSYSNLRQQEKQKKRIGRAAIVTSEHAPRSRCSPLLHNYIIKSLSNSKALIAACNHRPRRWSSAHMIVFIHSLIHRNELVCFKKQSLLSGKAVLTVFMVVLWLKRRGAHQFYTRRKER